MSRLLSMRLTILTVLFLLLGTADLITRRSDAQGQRGISTKGYILQAGEGESVMGGNVLVKVGPRTGAKRMAVATQRMPPGFRVPEHTHRAEEVVLVFRGSGTAILDGAKYPVSEGSIVFVPPGTWHGFIASDGGMDGVGFVSPAGLEGFFRDLDRMTDGGKKEPSIDELNRIGRKYGDVYRVSQ